MTSNSLLVFFGVAAIVFVLLVLSRTIDIKLKTKPEIEVMLSAVLLVFVGLIGVSLLYEGVR